MSELSAIFIDLVKKQVDARADQIWWTFLMMAGAIIFITIITEIIKEPLIKRWTESGWIVKLSVLLQGIVFMFGHGLFYSGMFSIPQRLALGIFIGCFSMFIWHVWDWWQNRKKLEVKSDGN
jgi:hypothetical protein